MVAGLNSRACKKGKVPSEMAFEPVGLLLLQGIFFRSLQL